MTDHADSGIETIRATVDKITTLLENNGPMPSEQVLALLNFSGVDGPMASTSIAYAVQQEYILVDWNFTLSLKETVS